MLKPTTDIASPPLLHAYPTSHRANVERHKHKFKFMRLKYEQV